MRRPEPPRLREPVGPLLPTAPVSQSDSYPSTPLDLAAFRREAQGILELPVDVATADMLKQPIRDQMLAEALPL
jgi:predicted nucleotidyltransferase